MVANGRPSVEVKPHLIPSTGWTRDAIHIWPRCSHEPAAGLLVVSAADVQRLAEVPPPAQPARPEPARQSPGVIDRLRGWWR